MTAKIGVITFPGTLDEPTPPAPSASPAQVVNLGTPRTSRASTRSSSRADPDGDYPRSGAIFAIAPVMPVVEAAGKGMPVLGICNGFRSSPGPPPAGAHRNEGLHFHCTDTYLGSSTPTPWTSHYEAGQKIPVPAKRRGPFPGPPDTIATCSVGGRATSLHRQLQRSLNAIAGITRPARRRTHAAPGHASVLTGRPSTAWGCSCPPSARSP